MAKIVSDIVWSGSQGSRTYSHNKGGAYTRNRRIPTNPTTVAQGAVRNQLAASSANWANLSDADRNAWSAYAAANPVIDRLGSSITISGQSMYVSCNTRLQQMGQAVITTPPIDTGPPLAFATATIVATAPDQLVVTFTPALAAGEQLAVWMTLPDDVGRNPNFNQARLVGFSAPADASPATITSRIAAIAGQVANIYLAKVDAFGRTSPKIKVRSLFV
jgi:hypothetical protein